MTTETTQQDDDFTAAFAQFGAETPPVDEPPAADAVAEEPATEPVAEEPATEPVAEEPAPATASDDELLARLAAMVKKSQDAPAPAQEHPIAPEPDIYTPEEQTLLKDYETDWPDVARAEALRRRSEYRDLVNHVFHEVAKELAPLAQLTRTLAERAHLTDLHEKVEDYDDVRDKVVDWVKNQPTYLQSAYKQVIQQGTPDEIADLISRYKKESSPASPAVVPQKQDTELPTTTKQAVAALAPVSSKRSTVVQAEDTNDFEGAFAKFAQTM